MDGIRGGDRLCPGHRAARARTTRPSWLTATRTGPTSRAQQALRDEGTASLEKTLDDQAKMADLVEPIFLGIAGLVVLFSAVSTRRSQRDERRRRAALDDDVPNELSEPPGSESPAVVNLLVAKGERVERGAVAGTILALVERCVLELHGLTSEEFVLRIPA